MTTFTEIPFELIMDELHLFLEEGRNYFNNVLEDRGFRTRFAEIVKSQETFEPNDDVVVQIAYGNVPSTPVATLAKEDVYNFSIDVQTCLKKKIQNDALNAVAGGAVRSWLNRSVSALSRQIGGTNINWYYSWAGDVVPGSKGSGAIKVARIPWECKIYNIYNY